MEIHWKWVKNAIPFIILITIFSLYFALRETKATALPEEIIQKMHPEVDYDKLKKMSSSFERWLKNGTETSVVPSVAVGIVQNDKLIYHTGYNATIDKIYDIASLSKTFTAILILQLQEQGYLNINDPVKKYIPDFNINTDNIDTKPITIKHLLSHTSGIVDSDRDCITVKITDFYDAIPKQIYPAGTFYNYSNKGFVILKHIIEIVTGTSYAKTLKWHILDPLGMTNSTGEYSNGTGGIRTNIRDLAKYTSMLLNKGRYKDKQIITPESYFEMLKPVTTGPKNLPGDYQYSLSWEVITKDNSVESFYKAGRWYGGASILQAFPNQGISFIYLCDPPYHYTGTFFGWRYRMTSRLRNIVKKIIPEKEILASKPQIDPQFFKLYDGNYYNELLDQTIRVVFKNNRLYSIINGSLNLLSSYNSNRFYSGKSTYYFVWEDNRLEGLTIGRKFYSLKQDREVAAAGVY